MHIKERRQLAILKKKSIYLFAFEENWMIFFIESARPGDMEIFLKIKIRIPANITLLLQITGTWNII